MLSLTLRQIEYAVAIAKYGGVSAAATRIHVSQPALSVALSQIEIEIGQPLFIRRPGGRLFPTAFAKDWLALAEVVLANAARLAAPGGIEEPVLRLALFEDFGAGFLAPLLRSSPPGRIDVQLLGFEAIAEALREGRVAAALTWDLGLDGDIRREVIGYMVPKVILSIGHELASRESLSLSDLQNRPLVLTDQGLSLRHMRGLFAKCHPPPRVTHRAASFEQMLSFAANGLGLGLSYLTPRTPNSQDGAGITSRPLIDAGSEPLVLAELASQRSAPAIPLLRSLLVKVFPHSVLADLHSTAMPYKAGPSKTAS